MKINFLNFVIMSFMTLSLMSCGDDIAPIEITAEQFVVTIEENPEVGQTLGSVSATTNRGILTYEVMSQDPVGSISVTPISGEIRVLDKTSFDYEEREFVTAMIMVANKGVENAIVARINITDAED